MSNFINREDVKTFNFKELQDKTLQMIVSEGDETIMLGGKDVITGEIYMIGQENKSNTCPRCKGSRKEYSVFKQEEQVCHNCNGKGTV